MASVMMTVELDPAAADLAAAAERLGVAPERLDAKFGVVAIDPDHNLYSVMVDESVGAEAGKRRGVSGPYSNPRIAPFGPPGASRPRSD
jgi:hypothetical protein